LLGRASLFTVGVAIGVVTHAGYACVRERAGDAFVLTDEHDTPIDVPSAMSTRAGERLPSAAEGDAPKAGASTVAPAAVPTGVADFDELRGRDLEIPVEGVARTSLRDTFTEARTGHVHEAIDILAPRGTPIVAVEDGRVEKLFTSKRGGLTIYQFDPSRRYCYYYAHLDRYAPGLAEGQTVKRGQVIGYVGISGNAPPKTPHLHFTIFKLDDTRRWWKGAPINPFPLWAVS
jgi:peptidoglycan LD-endopeptidase LytH